VTGNTGILTQRCDPYGIEVEKYAEKLAGGVYDSRHAGNVVWHCEERTIGRYRMVCSGGDYGFRAQGDGGLVRAYHCDGGHEGQVMNLCALHVREFSQAGYARPVPLKTPAYDAAGKAQHWAPGSQVGGSRASDMCPRCAFPPEARTLTEVADRLQAEMSLIMARPIHNLGIMTEMAKNMEVFQRLERQQDVVRARLDELHQTGRVHKCPVTLREVS